MIYIDFVISKSCVKGSSLMIAWYILLGLFLLCGLIAIAAAMSNRNK